MNISEKLHPLAFAKLYETASHWRMSFSIIYALHQANGSFLWRKKVYAWSSSWKRSVLACFTLRLHRYCRMLLLFAQIFVVEFRVKVKCSRIYFYIVIPGSMPPDSHSIFEEGAVFKSFKIVKEGVFQEEGKVLVFTYYFTIFKSMFQ